MADKSRKKRGKMMNSAEVCQLFKISMPTLMRWQKKGLPRHKKSFTSNNVYYENELLEWFENN